jgi:hypothetical protein
MLSPAQRAFAPQLAILLVAAAGLPTPARPQAALNGPEFQVNSYTSDYQIYPAVAADAAGDFVVAWASFPEYTYPPIVVRARIFPAQGPATGEEIEVQSGGWVYTVDVAADESGDFLVVWSDARNRWRALARLFTAEGVARGPAFAVREDTLYLQNQPAVAANPDGTFIVVWRAFNDVSHAMTLQARRFDADGVPLGDQFRVDSGDADDPRRPAVAAGAAGNFVVVWHEWNNARPDYRSIQGRRFGADGVPRGGQFQVNSYTTGPQGYPDVGMDAAGNFVVTWVYPRIHARRFDADGTPHTQFQVNAYTTGYQAVPRVAVDPAGDFVISWMGTGSLGGDTSGRSVHARRYDAGGVPRGGEFQVNTQTSGEQRQPSVAMDARGNFVVAWRGEYSPDDANWGVRAQRFDALFRDGFEWGDSARWHVSVP